MRHNVLFIARFDNILKGTNAILARTFNMQMCPPESEMVEKTLSVMELNAILIYISGLSAKQRIGICEVLEKSRINIPVVVLGTAEECEYFENSSQLQIREYLHRPTTAQEIVSVLSKLLGVSMEDTQSPAKPDAASGMSHADLADSLETDNRRCILLVDDDGRILRAMKMLLEKTYRVNLANSAMSALESIKRERPDAVLLDYEMPVHNGKEALEMIRQDSDIGDLPVFFLTGVADKDRVEEVINLKPQGYLLKNSDQNVILGALDSFFKGLDE